MSSAIAFRYQKLAIGMEALEEFHKKMPDPVKREKSWENVTKGVESRFFPEAIKRFDKLLSDIEATLDEIVRGLPAMNFHWRISATRRTSPGSITCNCSFSGTSGRISPSGTTACASAGLTPKRWKNGSTPNYLPLMKEKGLEVRDKVKAIVS